MLGLSCVSAVLRMKNKNQSNNELFRDLDMDSAQSDSDVIVYDADGSILDNLDVEDEEWRYIEIITPSLELAARIASKIAHSEMPIKIAFIDNGSIIDCSKIDAIFDAMEDSSVHNHELHLYAPMDDEAFETVAGLIKSAYNSLRINIYPTSLISYENILLIAEALVHAKASHTINLASILNTFEIHCAFFQALSESRLPHTIKLEQDAVVDFSFLVNLPTGFTLDLSTVEDVLVPKDKMTEILYWLEHAKFSLNIDLYGLFYDGYGKESDPNFALFIEWASTPRDVRHTIIIGWGDPITDQTAMMIKSVLQESSHVIQLDLSRAQASLSEAGINIMLDAIIQSAPQHKMNVIESISCYGDDVVSSFCSAIREHASKSVIYDKEGRYKKTVGYYYTDLDVRHLIEALLHNRADGTFVDDGYMRVGNTYVLRPSSLDDGDDVAYNIAGQIFGIMFPDAEDEDNQVERILIPIRLAGEAHWVTGEITISESNEISGRVYDSLGDASGDLIEAVLHELRSMGGNSVDDGFYFVSSTDAPSEEIYPIQAESRNAYCGGYTARLIANLATNSTPDSDDDLNPLLNIGIWNVQYPNDDVAQRSVDRVLIAGHMNGGAFQMQWDQVFTADNMFEIHNGTDTRPAA